MRNVCLILTCLTVTAVAANCHLARAENWPGWRGPNGDGISQEHDLPLTWNSDGENLVWKSAIPGEGYSSPIVWNDRVFLTTCDLESLARKLICIDAANGNILWEKTVVTAPLEKRHKFNSHASGTPVTDGRAVYVAFLVVGTETIDAPNVGTPRPVAPGVIVTAAYDFSGNELWRQTVGSFVSVHGFCSCPVIYHDKLIINGDHDGESYLAALDRNTGDMIWKVPRRKQTRSYVTPLIREINGKTQMVLSGSHTVTSYNPEDGSEYWTIDGPTEQFVASMVFDGSQFYLSAGFPTYHVMAIDPSGTGNVTDSHVSWHETNAKCYVPSPVIVDGLLFVADDDGLANCYDTKTGERLWRTRLGGHFSTSLVAAGGLVYFLADDGKTTVIQPARDEPVILAENLLDDQCRASPAISNGRIYVRGFKALYCIGK